MRSCSKCDVCKQRLTIKYMPEANFFNADIDENRHGETWVCMRSLKGNESLLVIVCSQCFGGLCVSCLLLVVL